MCSDEPAPIDECLDVEVEDVEFTVESGQEGSDTKGKGSPLKPVMPNT